jgi:sulfur carrier protein ThiS
MTALDPITVYTVTDAFEAQVIKNALADEGISCILAGVEQASTAALPGTKILIQVPAADAERARRLVESHEDHVSNTVADILAELGADADPAAVAKEVQARMDLELTEEEVARIVAELRQKSSAPPSLDQPPPENGSRQA